MAFFLTLASSFSPPSACNILIKLRIISSMRINYYHYQKNNKLTSCDRAEKSSTLHARSSFQFIIVTRMIQPLSSTGSEESDSDMSWFSSPHFNYNKLPRNLFFIATFHFSSPSLSPCSSHYSCLAYRPLVPRGAAVAAYYSYSTME